MMILRIFAGLFIFSLWTCPLPVSAAPASIEQLGSSAIEAQPSTEARKINSAKSQDLGDLPPGEPSIGNSNQTPDYQNNVLNNNYMTAYGRVKTTTENENNNGPMEANEPNTAPVNKENLPGEKKSGNDKLLQQEKKYNQAHSRLPKANDKTPDEQVQP